MKKTAAIIISVFLCLLVCTARGEAQARETANTLKYEEKAERPRATLADAGMLIGHWRGDFLGATAEEIWLPPAGGSMLGTFRLYNRERPVFYELLIIVEEEGSLSMKLKHFNPDLKGWEEKNDLVTFKLVKLSKDTLWFDGLTFSKQSDGTLAGFIAIGQKDGTIKEESFVYRPVKGR